MTALESARRELISAALGRLVERGLIEPKEQR